MSSLYFCIILLIILISLFIIIIIHIRLANSVKMAFFFKFLLHDISLIVNQFRIDYFANLFTFPMVLIFKYCTTIDSRSLPLVPIALLVSCHPLETSRAVVYTHLSPYFIHAIARCESMLSRAGEKTKQDMRTTFCISEWKAVLINRDNRCFCRNIEVRM